MAKKKLTRAQTKARAEELRQVMTSVNGHDTVEAQLLRHKLARELYTLLGEPTVQDFPEEFKTTGVYRFSRRAGYTTNVDTCRAEYMDTLNRTGTLWRIKSPSRTKLAIVERYMRAGWFCVVRTYDVTCSRYVKHPRYPHIWVKFYASRVRATYEYVLEDTN